METSQRLASSDVQPVHRGLPEKTKILLLGTGAIAINLPFINQAFHIDDPIYLLLARQAVKNPWFPQDVPIFFEGIYARDLASMEHPPLTAYLLAAVGTITGDFSEIVLHLAFLVFPLTLALSMYFLARRFTKHPMTCALLLLSFPVVYVMSHNLMTDLPLLALWTFSVAAFVAGVDGRRRTLLWTGAGTAVLASMVSYAGLCLIPLLMLYAWLRKDRYAVGLALLGPTAAVALWHVVNYLHYHRLVFDYMFGYYFGTAQVLSPLLLLQKLLYFVMVLGGVTLFPLMALALYSARERWRISAGICVALIGAAFIKVPALTLGLKLLFVFFCSSGLLFIFGVLRRPLRSPLRALRNPNQHTDQLFLLAWLLGMAAFCVVCFETGCARYILPLTPPLVLLSVLEMECRLSPKKFKRWASLAVVLGFSLALLLGAADYQFAGMYRDFAADFSSGFGHQHSRVWFTGEWGLRAYLEQLGGNELGRQDARPKKGDLLVVPVLATPYPTLFDDVVGIESVVVLAHSKVSFDIPTLTKDSVLVLMIGLPHWQRSDGLDFQARFVSSDMEGVVYSRTLSSEEGRRWRREEIPLGGLAGRKGILTFSAGPGRSGNADGDWVAIASARIRQGESSETSHYDFRGHLFEARVQAAAGVLYHTPENRPVFSLRVWLEQEPAKILLRKYGYAPALPVRLLDAKTNAGFWSMGWGFLPISISSGQAPLEEISVYKITREVDGYGQRWDSWYPDE